MTENNVVDETKKAVQETDLVDGKYFDDYLVKYKPDWNMTVFYDTEDELFQIVGELNDQEIVACIKAYGIGFKNGVQYGKYKIKSDFISLMGLASKGQIEFLAEGR